LAGRSAVFAISQRNAFIRAISAPRASRDELTRVIALKLPPLLPLGPGEFVSGFRVAADPASTGQLAIVGAVKSEILRAVYADAEKARLMPVAVLPLAFGSWLAAKKLRHTDCAVAQVRGDTLTIDLIAGGELRYSRSAPMPASTQEVADTISQTFSVAGLPPTPVVALGSPGLNATTSDPADGLTFLGDLRAIERTLFSLDLPDRVAAVATRNKRVAVGRAAVAAFIAVGFGLYVYSIQQARDAKELAAQSRSLLQIREAQSEQALAEKAAASADDSVTVLDHAFNPAQKFGDVVTVLSNSVSADSWLTGLTLERGEPVVVRGQTKSGKAITKLITDLTDLPRFRDVKLLSAAKASAGSKPMVQFALSGRAVGNIPIGPQSDKVGGL
jgi:hypothetical protein